MSPQNRKNTSERLELKKYNKFLRKVTVSAAALCASVCYQMELHGMSVVGLLLPGA